DRPIDPLLDASRVLVPAHEAREDLDVTGEGVAIAVFDSGIDPNHPDLAEKIVASFDATIPRGLIPGLLDAQQIPVVPEYTGGHGTHVAGIAAGPGTESRGRFAGIAPGASLVNVKVFRQDGEGSTSYVLQGLDWILANRETLGVRVAVMSLGAPPTDGTDALSRAVDVAAERGVLTVAAAGNHGPDAQTVRVPGVAARALTVGAVDKTLRIGEFSSRGPTIDGRSKPDIVAVGVDVTSTVPVVTGRGEYYGTLSGTSMAGPMVAGAAALVFAANATLDPATAKYILVASSQAVGDNRHRWDPAYGWGLLDVEAAVRAARDPSILTLPPLSETARLVVPDDDVSPLVRLSFETERSGRAVPLFSQVLVVAALGLAALVGRRPRIRRPQHSLYERIPPSN
ncbi:MAG: S8 family serine peptidase, partial [Methanobacteriota archaeon]